VALEETTVVIFRNPIKLEEVQFLKETIKRNIGIDLSAYKDPFIRRRLYARMLACNVKNVDQYLKILENSLEERRKFLDSLSINVSSFFRDLPVWEEVKSILKEALKERIENNGTLRIWSAGCACGQEPYTIAMLILEINRCLNELPPVRIYATDVDEDALQRARIGLYSMSDVKNVPPEMLQKYFLKIGNKYQVRAEVKSLVRFKGHDLIKDPPLRFMHIVFCRNVQIYMCKDVQQRILHNFYSCLSPPAYLILGTSETLSGKAEDMFEVVSYYARIYRKKNYSYMERDA